MDFIKYFLLQGKGTMLTYWLTGFMEPLPGNKEHSVIQTMGNSS